MKWTFGIITDGSVGPRIVRVIRSIIDEVSDAEIIVVGGNKNDLQNEQPVCVADSVYHIPFAENVKTAWITRKKNLIAKHSSHDNICIMHDYVSLEPGWLDGYNEFGEDWLACTNKICNTNNIRCIDWAVIFHDAWMNPPIDQQICPEHYGPGRLLNYNIHTWGRWQYYPGYYFCVKKNILLDIPFDESLGWNQGEDVKWSRLLYQKYGQQVFNFNINAGAAFIKEKDLVTWQTMPEINYDYESHKV